MKVLKPREAIKIARGLGWHVGTVRRTGELLFISPGGERFRCQGTGRTNMVNAKLASALQRHPR